MKSLTDLITSKLSEPKPTASFQRVVQRAAIHVQSSGREEVTGANVLVAIFSEREAHAVYFLQLHDMTRLDAVNYISHGIAKVPGFSSSQSVNGTEEEATEEKVVRKGHEALESYCVNLNQKAIDGKIDPLIGREPEIERTIQVLCRRTKNNPLYVGDPGVGKTAIAEGPWPSGSSRKVCPRYCLAARSIPSIWVPCWPVPATGATSRSASRRC